MGSPGVQFKAEKFQWLGSMTNEVAILAVMSRTGVASHRDMLTKEVIFGSSGPDGTEYYPSLMKNLFGSKIRIIEGYASAAEIVLALARGEVDGISQSYSGFVDQNPAWPKDGIVKFVVQMALSRHPALPDVPLIMDLVTPENLLPGYDVGEIRQLMEIQLSEASMGRPFTLGPGVPADRVSALRSAFDAMVKDPAVLADAKKSRLEVDATSGATIQELVNKVKQTPRASLDKLAGLIKYNGPRDQTNQPAAPAKK
jgi:tripartite-type tricarboxylate transporter receptor subunit TctC